VREGAVDSEGQPRMNTLLTVGSMLVITTLLRPIKIGFGAAIDAKDSFDIADMVEAAL